MFRLAILSDVHADVHALTDALATIDRMGCDAIVCAGDVLDYGLFPDETIALLAARGIPTVRGNHDRWAATGKRDQSSWAGDLSPASKRWLAGLPTSLRMVHEGVRVAVHHASPLGDMAGVYPDRLKAHEARHLLKLADADVLVVGHTHVALRIDVADAGVIVNPSALLRAPADGAENPPATAAFGVLELPGLGFAVHGAKDGDERPLTKVAMGRKSALRRAPEGKSENMSEEEKWRRAMETVLRTHADTFAALAEYDRTGKLPKKAKRRRKATKGAAGGK